MLPKVSVIIPARNEEKVIGNCVKSILASDYPKEKLDLIVAIDGSTDRTERIARSFGRRVRVMVSSPKSCKGEAINSVLGAARGEVVAIYDADCILDASCIRNAVRHFADPRVAGVSGTVKSYNKEQSVISRAIAIETCFISYVESFLSRLGANAHFIGKNMFIRRRILQDIGGFDVSSFIEDTELSIRLKHYRKGYSNVVFADDAVTWNEEPSTFRSFWNQRKRWSRGFLRLAKVQKRDSLKGFLSDAMHGIYFYASPFGLITGTVLATAWYMGLNIYLFTPLLALFLFNVGLLVRSRIHFKEPLRDLLYSPVWFLLSNLQVAIMLKSLIDERRGKEMKWFRVERADPVVSI